MQRTPCRCKQLGLRRTALQGEPGTAPGEATCDAEPMVEDSAPDHASPQAQERKEAGPAGERNTEPPQVATEPQAASPAAGLLPAACYVARSLPLLHAAMASSAAAAPEAGARTGRLWRAKGEPEQACMVRVSLRVLGPGTAEEGAALHALSPGEAASVRRRIVQRKQQRGSTAAERPEEDSIVPQSLISVEGRLASGREMIGYVTGEAPRGLPPWRGATGVCRASALWRQRHVARPGPEDVRAWPGTAVVAFRNAGTPTWRLAEAVMVVDAR